MNKNPVDKYTCIHTYMNKKLAKMPTKDTTVTPIRKHGKVLYTRKDG